MKQIFIFLATTFVLFAAANRVEAQKVGDCLFLHGKYVEIGVAPNGSLGSTVTPPTGYSTRVSIYTTDATGSSYSGNAVAEGYDFGHDGWSTGSPYPWWGDYTLPGSPFEGWSIEINGQQSDGYFTGMASYPGDFSNRGTVTLKGKDQSYAGSVATYSCSTGDSIYTALWAGVAYTSGHDTLLIRQSYRVDKRASWMVNSIVLTNISSHTLSNVYYARSCDPDNDEPTGGSFSTSNYIDYQNDGNHRVQVRATGTTYRDASITYSTTDCRAKCFIFDSWPPSSTLASDQYSGSGTSGYYYTVRTQQTGDIGIGIVFKLGSIPSGDSVAFSYSMDFDSNRHTIDSAFRTPKIAVAGGSPVDSVINITICDTTCLQVLYGNEKEWARGSWTWSPSTALASDTGVGNFVYPNQITSDSIIYTITGIDSAMSNCLANKVFTLIVHPCFSASNNSAICLHDTLKLFAIGVKEGVDSFYWVFPDGTIDTNLNPIIPNAAFSDSGTYYLIKAVAGGYDTARTHVVIDAPPASLIATSNGPVCLGDTLSLGAGPLDSAETFLWSGPGGFTSTLQNPQIDSFSFADSGLYTVIGSLGVCSDTTTIDVSRKLPPYVTAGSNSLICDSTTLSLTATDTITVGGAVYTWIGPGGFTSTTRNPSISPASFTDTGYYKVIVDLGGCISTPDSTHVQIKPNVKVTSTSFTNPTNCGGNNGTITLSGLDADTTYLVSFYYGGLVHLDTLMADSLGNVVMRGLSGGNYDSISLVQASFWGCPDTVGNIVLSNPILLPPPITGDTVYCQYSPYVPVSATATGVGAAVLWFATDTSTVGSASVPVVNTAIPGTYIFYAADTAKGCTSAFDSITVVVNAIPAPPAISGDSVYCQDSAFVPFTVTGSNVLWYVTGDSAGAGNSTAPSVNTTVAGTYTYYATQTVNGCKSSIDSFTVVVHATPATPVVTGDSVYCQNATFVPFVVDTPTTDVLWYTTAGGGTGSVATPTVNTAVPGVYTFYASRYIFGCPSPLAAFTVTVYAKPAPPTITTADTAYCYGQSYVPFTVVGSNIVWYNDSGGAAFTTQPTINTTNPGTYTYFATQTVNGCTSDSGSVTVKVLPQLTASFDTAVHFGCKADTVIFTDSSVGASTYTWNFGDGANDTAVNPTHIYSAQGSYIVSLITTNGGGICIDSAVQLLPLVHPLRAAFSVLPDTVCQGLPVTFIDSSYGTAYGNAATYQWHFGNGGGDTAFSPIYTYSLSGVYRATLVVGNFIPCYDTASAWIIVDSISTVSITATDSVLCGGSNFQFSASYSSIGNTGIMWNFGDGDSVANVNPVTHSFNTAGIYLVTVRDHYRVCPDVAAVKNVTVEPYPVMSLGVDTSICPGGVPISIYDYYNGANAHASWLWSTGDTTAGIIVTQPGTYYATVTVGGCQASDTVVVNNNCYMDIPNAFTPNNDGVNDYFFPRQFLTRGLYNFSMVIYDRWGQELFSTKSIDGRGWDGKFNNVDQPEGVYVYVIDATFIDGQKLHRQGNVTLLR
jgi:gliding motility-associated-like protein